MTIFFILDTPIALFSLSYAREPVWAPSAASERFERVVSLSFDVAQFAQCVVERDPLILELHDALVHRFEQQPKLCRLGGINVVEIEKFLDLAQAKPELLAAQDQDHAGSIAQRVDAIVAGAPRRDETLVLIEPDGARGHPQAESQ